MLGGLIRHPGLDPGSSAERQRISTGIRVKPGMTIRSKCSALQLRPNLLSIAQTCCTYGFQTSGLSRPSSLLNHFIKPVGQLLFIPAFQKKAINKAVMSAMGMNYQLGAMIEFQLIKIVNRYDRIICGRDNCRRNR